MELPAFVEFSEPVGALGIVRGDRVWVTGYSATLVRSLSVNDLHRHLHLSEVARVGGSPSPAREVGLDHPGLGPPS